MTQTKERRRARLAAKPALLFAVFTLLAVWLFVACGRSCNIFPGDLFGRIETQGFSPQVFTRFDGFGRLVFSSDKTVADCPKQTKDMAVVLAIGQSNSANHAGKRLTTKYPELVFNYYEGKCYVAASPLLGASGSQGEFITPLADKLIEDGTYKSVVIVSSGITGTPISRWGKGGDLNQMLLATLLPLQKKYKVTDIVWHQGEADFAKKTSMNDYKNSFNSLQSSLVAIEIKAPIYISVATKCGNNSTWKPGNPTALGQQMLANNTTIFWASNTDMLLEKEDRLDNCHFSESGQLKTANAYADAIRKHQKAN